jgi:hypothetical protein
MRLAIPRSQLNLLALIVFVGMSACNPMPQVGASSGDSDIDAFMPAQDSAMNEDSAVSTDVTGACTAESLVGALLVLDGGPSGVQWYAFRADGTAVYQALTGDPETSACRELGWELVCMGGGHGELSLLGTDNGTVDVPLLFEGSEVIFWDWFRAVDFGPDDPELVGALCNRDTSVREEILEAGFCGAPGVLGRRWLSNPEGHLSDRSIQFNADYTFRGRIGSPSAQYPGPIEPEYSCVVGEWSAECDEFGAGIVRVASCDAPAVYLRVGFWGGALTVDGVLYWDVGGAGDSMWANLCSQAAGGCSSWVSPAASSQRR